MVKGIGNIPPVIGIALRQKKLQACRVAQGKAVNWLLRHLHTDGALGNPEDGYHFYRAPWTFGVVGETAAANAVCGWIRRRYKRCVFDY